MSGIVEPFTAIQTIASTSGRISPPSSSYNPCTFSPHRAWWHIPQVLSGRDASLGPLRFVQPRCQHPMTGAILGSPLPLAEAFAAMSNMQLSRVDMLCAEEGETCSNMNAHVHRGCCVGMYDALFMTDMIHSKKKNVMCAQVLSAHACAHSYPTHLSSCPDKLFSKSHTHDLTHHVDAPAHDGVEVAMCSGRTITRITRNSERWPDWLDQLISLLEIVQNKGDCLRCNSEKDTCRMEVCRRPCPSTRLEGD